MAPGDPDKTPEEMAAEQVEMYKAGAEEIDKTPSLYSKETRESKEFALGALLGCALGLVVMLAILFFILAMALT